MSNSVESETEPSGSVARPDYQRRLVPLLAGAALALALGWLMAPQLDRALYPDLALAGRAQAALLQAVRQDADLRASLAGLGTQLAVQRGECGEPARRMAGQEMRLTPEVLGPRNFRSLMGCWTAAAGIKNARSGEDLSIEICFRERSAQVLAIIEPDGNRCLAGNAMTETSASALTVSSPMALSCSDGKTYNAPTIVCKPGPAPDFIADCQARAGSPTPVAVKFVRN
jgi:hypothetical protein